MIMMKNETWKIERHQLLKNKKNTLINEVYDKLDVLRTLAYKEENMDWFHRMNELCIWVGNQQEFKTWLEEVDNLDLGPAVITA